MYIKIIHRLLCDLGVLAIWMEIIQIIESVSYIGTYTFIFP